MNKKEKKLIKSREYVKFLFNEILKNNNKDDEGVLKNYFKDYTKITSPKKLNKKECKDLKKIFKNKLKEIKTRKRTTCKKVNQLLKIRRKTQKLCYKTDDKLGSEVVTDILHKFYDEFNLKSGGAAGLNIDQCKELSKRFKLKLKEGNND